ncbi:MAG: hypothetical protein AMS27_17855, partial [Bacteroides sp. SM23_62_1]
ILIRENIHTALSGEEAGLKAYFPFENVNVTDPSTSVNTLENMTIDEIGVAGACELVAGAEHTGEAPTIKLPRPVESIPFNYMINEDVVLIQPIKDPSLIENQVLTFSVRKVKDLHNNEMASTVTWTAFIDVNSLVWEENKKSLTKKPDEESEFKVKIVNKGGQKEYFTISNCPEWLDVSDDHGAIEPLGSKEITFTLFPGMNLGQYLANVYLSGNLEFNERLQVEVDVKVEPPLWEVDENAYQYSMSVIGQLKIDETLSTDVNDLVGAFLGKECVGVANVTYFSDQDIYLVFINIFSNNPGSGSIHFKVWDADQGRIYPEVTPVMDFKADDLVGSATNPQSIHALNLYANNIALAKGWNWISFNLNTDKLASLDEFLLVLDLQQYNDLIKNKVAYSQYNGVKWQGTLSSLEIGKMYMMMISQAQDFVYSGEPVVTGDMPIQLVKGWNWIGYTPQGNLTVKEAFGYHLPSAGDVVKSQFAFAIYDDLMGWIGSMQYMRPGLGYKYYSGDAATFYYPEKSGMKSLVDIEIPEAPEFIHQWPNSMNLIARIVPGDRVTEEYLVYAYRNKNITGLGLPVYNSNTGEWLWFIQVYGDTAGDKIGFMIENASGTEKLAAREEILFQADRIIGTLSEPVELTLADPEQRPSGIRVYPNPFTDELNVAIGSSDNLRIELTDLEGRVIWNYKYESVRDKYIHTLDLPSDLSEGVYILKIMNGTGTHYQKIIKQ